MEIMTIFGGRRMGILGSWLEIKPAVHRCLKPAALCLYSFPQLERAVVLLQGLKNIQSLATSL